MTPFFGLKIHDFFVTPLEDSEMYNLVKKTQD